MLFRHRHLLNKLREHGRSASAEIISVRTLAAVSTGMDDTRTDTIVWRDCWLHLRVVPGSVGEAPFEATVLTRMTTVPVEGGMVPVWYDPGDHAKVVVDYEVAVETKTHDQAHGELLGHRYDQRLGLAWTPVAGALLPVAVSVRPGAGRVSATGHLGALFVETADEAVAAVRAHAARLLPRLDGVWFAHHDVNVEEPYGDVPPGTTPDDAAGAGLAVAAALVSLLGGHLVRPEVSLTGRLGRDGVLAPVTDFRRRAVAAQRLYATRLVAPVGNDSGATHLAAKNREDLEFAFAAGLDDALAACLARRPLRTFVPPA